MRISEQKSSNDSITSTLTVVNSDKPKDRPRRVHFAIDLAQVIATVSSLRSMSSEEREQRYWLPVEYQTIRMSAKLETQKIMRNSLDDIDAVDTVYSTVTCLSSILDDDAIESMHMNPSKLSTPMRAWQISPNGRGLEKYVSSAHRADRAEVADDARRAVVNMSNTASIGAEDIALLYKHLTKSASLYARVVGEADADAARQVNSTEVVLETSDEVTQPRRHESRLGRPVLTRHFARSLDVSALKECACADDESSVLARSGDICT